MIIYIYKSLDRLFYMFISILSLILLYLFLFRLDYNNIQYFLSAGYDNFGHFGTYFASSQNGLSLILDKTEPLNFPKSIYSFYPPGFYSIFSYFNNMIFFPTNLKVSIINLLFFNILISLVLIFSLTRLVLYKYPFKSIVTKVLVRFTVMVFFTLYMFFGNFSHMIVSGYPHYFLGLVITLSILHVNLKPTNFLNFLVIMTGVFLLYKTIPVLLLLLAPIIFNIARNFIKQNNSFSKLWFVPAIASLPIMYFYLQPTLLFFNRFILNAGGIEPFPIFYFVLLCLITILLSVFKFDNQSFVEKRLSIFGIWIILSTSFLILYSFEITDEIRYYIVKQIYFGSIILIAIIFNKVIYLSLTSTKNKSLLFFHVATPMLGLLFFSLDLGQNPTVYKGSAMGSFPKTFKNIWVERNNSDLPFNPYDLNLASEYIKNKKIHYSVFVSYNGAIDLPSRWLSIYSNQFNDDTWSVYFNLNDISSFSKTINNGNKSGVFFDLYDRIELGDRENLSSLGWQIITELSELNE